jgi:hypothetical protein
MCDVVHAQGTANAPSTNHIVGPGPSVFIGNANNPIPIDLDPLGQPWTKTITDPNMLLWPNGGGLTLNETMINVGTEPWYDWHEQIAPDIFGNVPAVWQFVFMTINGNPVGFTLNGMGTPNLDIYNFSQPVLPGDVLNIRKFVNVLPANAAIPPQPLVIHEYPTPEPASAALIGLGATTLVFRRREVAQRT